MSRKERQPLMHGSRPGWEEFSLEELVYDDEDGNMEPDSDAIWELANQFVDLRQR